MYLKIQLKKNVAYLLWVPTNTPVQSQLKCECVIGRWCVKVQSQLEQAWESKNHWAFVHWSKKVTCYFKVRFKKESWIWDAKKISHFFFSIGSTVHTYFLSWKSVSEFLAFYLGFTTDLYITKKKKNLKAV